MYRFLVIIITLFVGLLGMTDDVHAAELTPVYQEDGAGAGSKLCDKSHYTIVTLNKGNRLTVTSKDGQNITGVYICWDSPSKEWTLTTDNGDIACGRNGFLHEYVKLEQGSKSVTVIIPDNGMRISELRIFSEGELPNDVQVWNPPCEKADILLVSSHADDEILFFGGILPTYAYNYDAAIQVVYLAQFWSGQKVREHEKLDGLWECGVRNYPVCGNFADVYSETIETAMTQYNYNDILKYLVEQFRIFQPQVVVTHDVNGEYGHGFHKLTSKAVTEAVVKAADAGAFAESAQEYGTWDTPKTYLHCLKDNAIKLNLRVPISEDYAGRTALDIAIAAYKKHVSQQWCWFYVSDEYEYSCADFGLYRSLVGADTDNDILCNLKTYKVQKEEKEKAEQESREAESRQQESREQVSREDASRELESKQQAETLAQEQEARKQREFITAIIIIAVVAIVVLVVILIVLRHRQAKKRRKVRIRRRS